MLLLPLYFTLVVWVSRSIIFSLLNSVMRPYLIYASNPCTRCPGLSDCWGKEFEELFESYEKRGKGRRTIKARELWYAILDAQIETGNPYMLYKDACNSKSNQQNLGTIKCSNLCTEILEYTAPDEVAVCNLASIVLPKFVVPWNTKRRGRSAAKDGFEGLGGEPVAATATTAIRTSKVRTQGRGTQLSSSNGDGEKESVVEKVEDILEEVEEVVAEVVQEPVAVDTIIPPHGELYNIRPRGRGAVGDSGSEGEGRDADADTTASNGTPISIGLKSNDPAQLLAAQCEGLSPDQLEGYLFDHQRLYEITKVITRNLNKIIDVNYYPVIEARNSNMRHRPIGIGVQGLADAFQCMKLPFDCPEAKRLNKDIFETIYFAALDASCELAEKLGPYEVCYSSWNRKVFLSISLV
jgi:ribonucleotide reductase alpha subunit